VAQTSAPPPSGTRSSPTAPARQTSRLRGTPGEKATAPKPFSGDAPTPRKLVWAGLDEFNDDFGILGARAAWERRREGQGRPHGRANVIILYELTGWEWGRTSPIDHLIIACNMIRSSLWRVVSVLVLLGSLLVEINGQPARAFTS
jgi:hypothetical protein